MEKCQDSVGRKQPLAKNRPHSIGHTENRNVLGEVLCICDDPGLVCPIRSHRNAGFNLGVNRSKLQVDNPALNLLKQDRYDMWQTSYQLEFKPIDPLTLRTMHELDNQLEAAIHLENSASHLSDANLAPHKSILIKKKARVEEAFEKPAKFITAEHGHIPHSNEQATNVWEYNRAFRPYRRRDLSSDLAHAHSMSVADHASPLIAPLYNQFEVYTKAESQLNSVARNYNRRANQADSIFLPGEPQNKLLSKSHAVDPGVSLSTRVLKEKTPPPLPNEFKLIAPYLQFDETKGLWRIKPAVLNHKKPINN